jgi:nucleoid-associated protein YgaU
MSSTAPVIHLEDFLSRRSARERPPAELGVPSSGDGTGDGRAAGVPLAPPAPAPPRRTQPERRRPRPAGVRACGESARSRPNAAGSLALTRRGWVTVAVLVAVLVSLGGIGASAVARQATSGPGADGPETAGRTTTVLVQPGQTLWEIAGEVAPTGTDIRVTVDRIAELNGLQRAGDLEVGERLVIPATGGK